jgi:hypothetical protein
MIPVSIAVSIVLLQNLGTNLEAILPDVITPWRANGYGDRGKWQTVAIGRTGETFPAPAV